jgi:hypothetical protein
MKKIIVRIAAIILLLLIFFKVFLLVREHNSYKNSIHRDATFVLKINVDGIIKTIAWDCITSPGYYLNYKKDTKKDTSESGKGISLPANIFVYSLKQKSAKTFFCSLPVSDTLKMKRFAADKFSIDSFYHQGNISIGLSANHKTTIAFNNETVALAYSMTGEEVLGILQEIVEKKNMLTSSDTLMQQLKEQDEHVCFVAGKNAGQIHFGDGKATLTALINNNNLLSIPDQSMHRKLSEESIAKGWINGTFFKTTGNRDFAIKDFSFNTDSLLSNYNGYADFEVSNKEILQEDSIVTYSYNDDFEKVAETTVAKNKVPEIGLSLRTKGNSLLNYLQSNDAIKSNGVINRDLFPLYAMHVSASDSFMHVSTNYNAAFADALEVTDYFFYLFANIEKIKTNSQYSSLKRYLTNMKSFEIKARKKGEGLLSVEGELKCVLPHVNALPQMED